ncbi:hypothetical protein ElyMa_005246400 [Elysia marginata]|uniref:Uncharacterized protein n=1 Tax=Elysia marginata TaxID=1093978 RepID=A0AAV4JWN1_9GAST|nr:hypothetical protein ElyMa_005246400 [Elysia marginata]
MSDQPGEGAESSASKTDITEKVPEEGRPERIANTQRSQHDFIPMQCPNEVPRLGMKHRDQNVSGITATTAITQGM